MKLTLIAELIKVAGHDIGHFPLSHAFEEQVFQTHGAHEIIGQRLMLENPEIQSVLLSISDDLPEVLSSLYSKPVLNFSAHDESSYDVDRLDYVSRDALYKEIPYHFTLQNIPLLLGFQLLILLLMFMIRNLLLILRNY